MQHIVQQLSNFKKLRENVYSTNIELTEYEINEINEYIDSFYDKKNIYVLLIDKIILENEDSFSNESSLENEDSFYIDIITIDCNVKYRYLTWFPKSSNVFITSIFDSKHPPFKNNIIKILSDKFIIFDIEFIDEEYVHGHVLKMLTKNDKVNILLNYDSEINIKTDDNYTLLFKYDDINNIPEQLLKYLDLIVKK